MSCQIPPPLTEDQISAVLDGMAGPEIQRHLDQCQYCAQRVEQAQALEQLVAKRLFRFNCPSSQAVSHYHLGLVDAAEVPDIERHLDQCPHCRAELDDLAAFLADMPEMPPSPQPKITKPQSRVGELLARFVPHTPQAAFRGGTPALTTGANGPLKFEVAGITIFLELEAQGETFMVTGGLVAEPDQLALWAGALVNVWQNDTVQAVTTVDDLWGFQCKSLALGVIDVRITAPDGRYLLIENIELQE